MAENKVIGIGLNDGVEDIIYGLGGGGIEEWENYEEVDISGMFNDEGAPEELINWFNTKYPNGKVKIVDICVPFFEMQMSGKEEPDTPPYMDGAPFYQYKNQNIEVKEGIFHGGGFVGGFLFVMKSAYWEMYMVGAMQMSDVEEAYICSAALGITLGQVYPLGVIFKARGIWYWGVMDM